MDYMQLVQDGNIKTLEKIYTLMVDRLPCRIISQPATGRVMMSNIDPQEKTKTRISEYIATYCEIEVDGNIGYGCVHGNDPERAKYAALVDSLIFNDHPAVSLIKPLLNQIRDELRFNTLKKQRGEICV